MLLRLDDRLGQSRPDTLTVAAIVAGFVAAALLAGYVIASGQPVPIALLLGTIAGIAMLGMLPLVVWTILVGVLLISGPVVMFVPALEKGPWLFSLLGFLLAGAAVLYAAVGRERFSRPLPAFVVLAIVLLSYGLLSLVYSGGPLMEGVRATKRYFQFYGLLFILAVLPFAPALVRRWWRFIVLLAVLQLPFALYQFLVLVPIREGMPQVVPLDIVVGTMEGSIVGGGSSGVMVLLLLFVLSYVLAALRESMLPPGKILVLAPILVTPFALGEVNLIFVLLPLALMATYVDLIRQRPFLFMLGAAFAVPVLAGLAWWYLAIQAGTGQPLDLKIAEILDYNFGGSGYYGRGLNRTSVYSYWFAQHGIGDPVSFLFGHGLGSSFGGINEPNPGHMDKAHAGMFIGLTAAAAVLWDLGLTGLLVFMGMLLSAVRYAYRLTLVARPGFDRAFCRGLLAMAVMLVVMPLYSEAPVSMPSLQVLTALTLGLVAWRWRHEERNAPRARDSHAA